jgi:sulfate permease, SulP family
MTSPVRTQPGHRFSPYDILAGVSVALIAIPQGMAYAELAGLPGLHGLYAVAFPVIAAAFFASSPYLQTGPVATTALLTLGALVPLAAPGSSDYVALAALLALVVGVTRIAVGLAGAGVVSYLMSRPVLDGFMSAAAILIVSSQLPGALGSPAPDGGVLARAGWALVHPDMWRWDAIAFSVGTIAVVSVSRRLHPLVPGVLIASVGGLVASVLMGFDGETVGDVPAGLPPFMVGLPWSRLPSLIFPGIVIALVGFAEAASICRTYASEERQAWNANREFISQGVANVAAGLTGAFPVGGSFARSAINRLAGARSRWSGLVTGLTVLAFLPFADVLAPLPRSVLAGIVMAAIWSLFRPGRLVELWVVSPLQALVGWGTFGFTLLLAPHIEQAVLLGVVLAVSVHLWREFTPGVESRREGETLHLEPRGVLWYGSAPALEEALLARLAEDADVARVVVHCGGLGRIDLTGAYGLAEMMEQVRRSGVEVTLEGVPAHARRVLSAVGAIVESSDGEQA